MRLIKHLTTWLLLLTVITASGLVSAKVASGVQNLSGGLHQENVAANALLHLAKIDFSYDDASGFPLVPKSVGNGADNIANASRLAKQLRLQSARSPFTAEGKLTSEALKNSRRIIKSSELNNPAIPKGFNKYSTETFQSPSGNFQTHFYRNPQTGEVLYGLDYKAVFNAASGK